jgi:endogenous inhibitor of DNA gyrase (YacG/DUF329 family)
MGHILEDNYSDQAMTRATRKRVRKWGWAIYLLYTTGIGIRAIYVLGQWTVPGIEFALYTVLMFAAVICLYYHHLKSAAFWITWASLLMLQLGVGGTLFWWYWPGQHDLMRTDLFTMKMCWLSISLAEIFYAGVLGIVLHIYPDLFKVRRRMAQAAAAVTAASPVVETPSPVFPEVPALTFQLIHRGIYRCPKCGGEIDRSDLHFAHSFDCKHCGISLDLDRDLPRWAIVFYVAAGAGITWLLGVRHSDMFLFSTVFCAVTLGYLVSPFVPPTIEICKSSQGVSFRPPEVSALTFQLIHRGIYRCPACAGEIDRTELHFTYPFDCKKCGVSLELRKDSPKWLAVLYFIAGAWITWLLGVREPFKFELSTIFCGFAVAYLVSPLVPPTIELHQPWHGVPSQLIGPGASS